MAHLILLDGPEKGKRFEIKTDLVRLGRKPGNDFMVEGPAVSGTHCQIARIGTGYQVTDLGSTNGTRLDGERIEVAWLTRGCTLTLGETNLRVAGDDVPENNGANDDGDADTSMIEPTRVAIRPRTVVDGRPAVRPAAFGAPRDSQRIWARITVAFIVLVLLAAVWFVVYYLLR